MALSTNVKVHPVVLFQIVDAYERRNADAHRVIGTLLGSVEKGVVEVTNCFCVPHKEYEDQVEAELNYAMDLYDLNRRVNTQETIVGWWATGNEVTSHSSVIHEYYARECNNPIHLTLDTTLQGNHMGIKSYVNVPIGVPGGKSGCMFTPVNVEITCYEPEVVGVAPMLDLGDTPHAPVSEKGLYRKNLVTTPEPGINPRTFSLRDTNKATELHKNLQLCQKTASSTKSVEPMLDLAQVAEASRKLTSLLDNVLAYVEDVLANRTQPDNAVGRALLDMVNSVPKMTPEEFENMFNSNVKDLLMVITLSQLVKTQLQLNEKLTLLTTL